MQTDFLTTDPLTTSTTWAITRGPSGDSCEFGVRNDARTNPVHRISECELGHTVSIIDRLYTYETANCSRDSNHYIASLIAVTSTTTGLRSSMMSNTATFESSDRRSTIYIRMLNSISTTVGPITAVGSCPSL